MIPKGGASPGGLLCDAVEASQVVFLWLAVSLCAVGLEEVVVGGEKRGGR